MPKRKGRDDDDDDDDDDLKKEDRIMRKRVTRSHVHFPSLIVELLTLLYPYLQDTEAFAFLRTCRSLFYAGVNHPRSTYKRHDRLLYKLKSRIRLTLDDTIADITAALPVFCNSENGVVVQKFPIYLMNQISELELSGHVTKLCAFFSLLESAEPNYRTTSALRKLSIKTCDYHYSVNLRRFISSLPSYLTHFEIYDDDFEAFWNDFCLLPPALEELKVFVWDEPPTNPTRIFSSDLITLVLSGHYSKPFPAHFFPSSLMTLDLYGNSYNSILNIGVLPLGLQHLYFGDEFNQPLIPGVLPPHLKSLSFGAFFNQLLYEGVLPNELESLKVGDWNAVVNKDVFPPSLQSLEFGYSFNHPIGSGVLPVLLKRLLFGRLFNQVLTLENLPSSLTCLIFEAGSYFKHPIKTSILPRTLTCLSLPNRFPSEKLTGELPPNLQMLQVFSCRTRTNFMKRKDKNYKRLLTSGHLCEPCRVTTSHYTLWY
jgi:FNIP Repeat